MHRLDTKLNLFYFLYFYILFIHKKIDKNMENKKEKVAISSILAGISLTLMKFIVGILTGSIGIISEAIHSLLDLAAAIMTFFAVRFGDRPADKDHHYGHGKIESVSALIETGLLFITSFWIISESIHKITTNDLSIKVEWYAFAVMIISIIVDFSRSRALTKVAKETGSKALEADALHFSSDILSSSVVLIGLTLSLFGIHGADAFAAIGVAIFVGLAGYRLGKSTIDTLIDKAPNGIYEEVENIIKENTEILDIERMRIRHSGSHTHIELTLLINRKLSTEKTKEISNNIEFKIKENIKDADLIIHTKPVKITEETIVDHIQILAAKNNVFIHDIIVDVLNNKKYVSYDLELPEKLTIKEAHEIATNFENEIKKEIDENIELNSHIEPLKQDYTISHDANNNEVNEILNAIKEINSDVKELKEPHNILVRKIDNKKIISFHCFADEDKSLEEIHNYTVKYEYLMKEKIKDVKRTIIHVECEDHN